MPYYLSKGAYGSASSSAANLDDWQRRAPLVIQSSQVAETNSLFPILLTRDNLPTEMIDAGSNSALSGGADIRFTSDINGLIPLGADIVEFVPDAVAANRFITIWVRAPVDSGSDTTIYVWYKNPTAVLPSVSDPNFGPAACWQAGDIRAVYHLNVNYNYGSEGTDATARGNNMTPVNGPTNVAGSWAGGRALAFDPTPVSYMQLPSPGSDLQFTTLFTFFGRALTNTSGGGVTSLVGRQFGSGSSDSYLFGRGALVPQIRANSVTSGGTLVIGVWASLHAVKNANSYERMFLNGAQVGNTATPGSPLSNDANTVEIAAIDNGSPSIADVWDGDIAHVRMDGEVRSNNYVLTHHNTMNAPGSFVVPGTPVTP